ncbi:hypothetical protein GH714_019574 [Hevea brasiliensis]|uniref:Uncharacterized protein n=1 Tax=Hevea brasiliensis TaxID=3981 RepID=A0A6A6MCY1_HEVBR|nr:hypothetical protein GH714_019574 [Hevea brasiliensis]
MSYLCFVMLKLPLSSSLVVARFMNLVVLVQPKPLSVSTLLLHPQDNSVERETQTQIMIEQMEDLRKKLEAEGQSLAIQDLWNCGAADGNSNFALHASQSNPLDCDPGPVLQIGYSYSLADQLER